MGRGVLLRVFCVVSRIPRVAQGEGFFIGLINRIVDTSGGLRGRGY